VLLDVKTGKSGLNWVQRKIEAAAAEKRVSFDVLRLGEPAPSDPGIGATGSQQLKLTLK